MSTAPKFWYSQNLLAWLLWPLSLLFFTVVTLRRWLYQKGFLSSHKLPVPVIVVGNISVGGTGKTPLIIALCEWLKNKGFNVGVVSRGYGRDSQALHEVAETDSASIAGDEPLLIKRHTACPVMVCADRPAAANSLYAKHQCNIILSDDGLQHYALQRDVEIAVVDAERKYGNGFCLPAGPLREPVSRLQSVDMLALNVAMEDDAAVSFSLQQVIATQLIDNAATTLQAFSARRAHAVAGIGHPQRFFKQLRQQGIDVIEHSFDDHHRFQAGDLDFNDDLPVLMTEKDAVKCTGFAQAGWWSINVRASLSQQLTDTLCNILEEKHIQP